MTQLELARGGIVSAQMEAVARKEGLNPETVREGVAQGSIVIPANVNHKWLDPCGIGKGLATKVNANLGTSSDFCDIEIEMAKLDAALDARTDTVMDLSTGGDIPAIRRALLRKSPVAFGTVPIYQAGIAAIERHGAIVEMTAEDMFDAIEGHARDGVDFLTVHCAVNQKTIARLKADSRLTDVVSRGGSFLIGWILHNERENPLYEDYDRLLEIARRYDVTLSLGDGLRPGSLADASDRAQFEELLTIGELVDRARDAGVQVMVEGPGHMPINQIAANVLIQKRVCKEAPFYVLGPLVTDVGAGHDHITSAIGGAVAAAAGVDFLCYVTPSEHLALPTPEEVREGVIASRIAAHAGDIAKGIPGASQWDYEMSVARKKLDWDAQIKLALDPKRAAEIRSRQSSDGTGCTMCGKYCAMQLVSEYLGTARKVC
ncbi:MAG: phosphomethylpyrimidine synthase ThiC [Chloroflexi bacterium]|nr:phosphomethylpyrimidine synthase ThiC [Chloroflexota bacterium]